MHDCDLSENDYVLNRNCDAVRDYPCRFAIFNIRSQSRAYANTDGRRINETRSEEMAVFIQYRIFTR